MSREDVIKLNYEFAKWTDYHGSDDLPGDTELACVHGFWCGIATIDKVAWFRRTAHRDELWVQVYGTPEYIIHGPRAGHEDTACRRLFECLVRNTECAGPDDFMEAGLITRRHYNAIVDKIRRGLEENRKEALVNPPGIVKVAEQLRLSPDPDTRTPDKWMAHCPGIGHGLEIDASSNQFYCGYCRQGGGPEELEAFVESRKKGILSAGE